MVCDIGLILTAAGMMSYPELLGTVDNHVHIPTENHPMLFFFFFPHKQKQLRELMCPFYGPALYGSFTAALICQVLFFI